MGWLAFALVSAGAAALTAILAKIGIEGVPSNLATAIRTIVLAAAVLGESVSWRLGLGVALMTVGAILTIG